MVELKFAANAHSVDAVQRAAYRFSDRFTVEIRQEGGNVSCALHPIEADEVLDETIVSSFRAEVLDQVLRERIRAETAPVRNAILALAFANTGLRGAVVDNEPQAIGSPSADSEEDR